MATAHGRARQEQEPIVVARSGFFDFDENTRWTAWAATQFKDDYEAMSNYMIVRANMKYPDGWLCNVWRGNEGHSPKPDSSDFIIIAAYGITFMLYRSNDHIR